MCKWEFEQQTYPEVHTRTSQRVIQSCNICSIQGTRLCLLCRCCWLRSWSDNGSRYRLGSLWGLDLWCCSSGHRGLLMCLLGVLSIMRVGVLMIGVLIGVR